MSESIQKPASATAPDPSAAAAPLSALKRAFLALEAAQARVAALEQAAREPIAVIGLGCRVPGGAHDSDSFWRIMRDGVDTISRLPADRFDIDAYYDADTEAPGKISTREGGFLGAIDGFDAEMFGIAPREAQGMDPQQRLLLEVSWEALEHAGQAPDRLEHSATGVYVGVCGSDYTYLQLETRDRSLLDAHFTSGMAHSVFSGRLSYLLGLQGPSLTIDTACSSSLVAVHLACQALRAGECRMALAGGVNLILGPDIFVALSHSRMLAPDGRCKTFDAAADGFARGEGCGVIVLKRLSDARTDGDRILAVIRGSAVNQDGPSSGLTAPNGPAQEAVIREALARANIAPREVGFIEAHGTGTQLGDPLEVHALGAVFGPDRGATPPLWIGSAKTNLGHLEAAAGITGLIKLVLSLQHRVIPAHLHFTKPSPHINWADFPLRVPTQATAWEPIGGRRIGGVSSFGFSGTNAHVVLEEAPARESTGNPPGAQGRPCLFTLSARDGSALAELATRHVAALAERTEADLPDICHTANVGRAHFAERATVVARSMAELHAGLAALARSSTAPNLRTARVASRDPARIAFLFTGQGAQYVNMAQGLYEAAPVFRAALDRCAGLLAPHLGRSLLEVIFNTEGRSVELDETAYTQPALFAVEYALAQLWRSWGVTPNIVMGHSVGELVAACVADVFELGDALRLVALRGQLMQSLPAGGTMAAISAPESIVAEGIAPYPRQVSIAAVNSPAQTVISGRAAEVAAACERFAAMGVRCKQLTVSHAFHSPLVEPILERFEREVALTALSAPRLRLISNLTGRLVAAEEMVKPSYWRQHIRAAVRFDAGLNSLAELRPDCIIEIGPHPTLLSFAGAVFGGDVPRRIASLQKGTEDWEQMLNAVSALYLAGVQIDWRALDAGCRRQLVDLPGYPFQRERYWFQAKPVALGGPRGRASGHALLGVRLRNASAETIYESRVGADEPSFVRQHRVLGRVVLPATAYLDTLLACGRDVLRTDAVSIENVTVNEAMLLPDDGALRTIQTVCTPARDGVVAVAISSVPNDADEVAPWTGHVAASLRAGLPAPASSATLDSLRAACTQVVTHEAFYADFETRGLDFGPGFRTVRQLWRGSGQALGVIELTADLAARGGGYQFHPVLLDGCLQVMAAAMSPDEGNALYLPIGITRYSMRRRPVGRCWSHVAVQSGGGETRRADIHIFDEQGSLLAELQEVQLKRVTRDALERLGERWLDDCLYETRWQASPVSLMDGAEVWSPGALTAAAAARLPALEKTVGLPAHDIFLARLEAICADYAIQTMQRLGWTPRAGERVQETVLADRLRVLKSQRRLFSRVLAILAEEGWLTRDPAITDGWQVARPFPEVDPQRDAAALARRSPEAELELTARVAAEFAEALRGEREPMQLLFPGGSLDTAERLYRDSPTAKFYNGMMAELTVAVATARKAGRTLRILEVGAGTGGTTAHVLPRMPTEGIEYTFTDVGPLFVARAKERFGSFGFARFETLDLEREPASQGFAGRQFDIVIASNVIHATADLRRTLARVRGLLAPGGLLAMLEVTAPQRWFDFTVGLTEGWWAFSDLDLRPDYPTMSRERWLKLLAESGFDECAALPAGNDLHGSLSLQSLLLARSSRSAMTSSSHTWLVFSDAHGTADSLVKALRARNERCIVVRPGTLALSTDVATVEPGSAADYKKLLALIAESGRTVHGVVHAWALNCVAWDSMTGEGLVDAQSQGVLSSVYVAQALIAQNPAPRLWIVTRGGQAVGAVDRALAPMQATVWGLGKTLALEHPELSCVCVDLDSTAGAAEIEVLLGELSEVGSERHVAVRGDARFVARLVRMRRTAGAPLALAAGDLSAGVPLTVSVDRSWRLVPERAGSLDGFCREPSTRRVPGAGEVEVAVEATALNFKDVLNALGMYPGDPGPLGGECAGRVIAVGPDVTHVRPGDEVMLVAGGSFASHVIARAELVQPRPLSISVEEAASFSIPYLTAEFCLGHLARMTRGESVLIHAAAGGVGMAAVRLAQRAGAEIFATAGSQWKRDVLRSIGVTHVLDSRSASFADEIARLTGGRGVDIVLNSLSGELIDASFKVLARGGRFVEIGKRGIKEAGWVADQKRELRYFVVDWGDTAAREPALIGDMFARLVAELRDGVLSPLPLHVFTLDSSARAFRFMAQARHAGKIVVRHAAATTLQVRRNGSYLIAGGLSGLGLLTARWLGSRGAGRLVLVGRRGITSEAASVLAEIRAAGTQVVAESLDLADEAALRALLVRLRTSGPPLRGVINSAGVLDDAGLMQQDAQRFAHVFAPKVRGGWLLDSLTRNDPLDWFVSFSSVAAVLGSPGQANHSAANAFLDVLAHERRNRGLAALSINWGPWTEIGAAADRGLTDRLATQGLGALTPNQGLLALQRLLESGTTQAAVLPVSWKRYLERFAHGATPAFFADVANESNDASAGSKDAGATSQKEDLRQQLQDAPESRRRPMVTAFVRSRALRALGVDPAKPVDPRAPLGDLGLDSLLAVELRNTLGAALGKSLPATLLFDYPSIDTLSDYLLSEVLQFAPATPETPTGAPAAAPATSPSGLVGSIEAMSDDEVDRLIAARSKRKA